MGRYIQTRFIFRNMAYLAMVVVAGCFIAYAIIYKALSTKLALSFSQAFYQIKAVHDGMDLIVWFSITLYGIITWTCILAICLFATHKVAGPLFRLELVIKGAKEGDFPSPFMFREGDQIAPLAEVKNRLFDHLGNRENRLGRLAEDLNNLRHELEVEMISKEIDHNVGVEKVRAILEEIADWKDGQSVETEL